MYHAILVALNKKKQNQLGKKEQKRKIEKNRDRCRNEISNDHYGWKGTNFLISLLRSSYNYIKYVSTNLTAIIMPSSLRRSLRFLTVRTRSANMEQSRTSKLHTTLSMPIDSSLIYARYILKRKLQSHMLPPMYYLSRSVKIHTYRRKIRD